MVAGVGHGNRAVTGDAAPLMGAAEAVRLLGVNRSTVCRLARQGKLPGAVRIGGQWKFNRAIVSAMIAGTTPPQDDTAHAA